MNQTCENCGRLFDSPNKRRSCARSCAVALSWRNPDTKAARKASISRQKQSPEAMALLAAHNERRWSKPGEREKMSEQNRREWSKANKRKRRIAGIKKSHRRPEMRAFYSRMRTTMWGQPEYREKALAGMRAAKGSPEARAMFSQLLTDRWNDPEMRAKYTAGNRRRSNDPAFKERMREHMLRRWRDNDDFRALCAAAMELYWSRPEAREANSARMKALWSDPVWKMKTMERIAQNPRSAVRVYKHMDAATDLMSEVNAVIPKTLPDFMRMDVASDITLALLEGDLKLTDLKANAHKYLAAHRRMFPDKWGPVSIDAPLPGTENFTIADTLSNESPHF